VPRPALARVLAFGAATLLVAGAAVHNGYPLVYSDTGTYLASSFSLDVPPDRPVFYGLFLRATHLGLSLWPVVLAQSAIAVLLVRRVLDLYGAVAPSLSLVAAVAALAVATPLPWVAGQVMPDAWTGMLVLALFLVLHDPRARGLASGLGPLLVLFWGSLVHLSHLALGAVLVAAEGVRAWWSGEARARRGGVRRAALALAAALVFALSVNAALSGRPALTRISWTFVLSRLVQDGIVQELLAEVCQRSPVPYRLCAHRREIRPSALHFIWDPDSPVQKLGGALAVEDEARAIVLHSLRRHPWLHVQAAIRSWIDQLGAFTTGDGLQAYDSRHFVTQVVRKRFAREANAYASSRQQLGELPLDAVAAVQRHALPLFAGASLVFLCAGLAGVPLASRELHVFVWLALVANAAICGLLSGPFPRYQSRIVWLVPLACIVSLREIASARGLATRQAAPVEPGTPGDGTHGDAANGRTI
jgi:hypothetical protein